MLLASVLAAALTAGPFDPQASPSPPTAAARLSQSGFRFEFDVGGFLGSAWYVDSSRRSLESARFAALGFLLDGAALDTDVLFSATPVLGPWMTAAQANELGFEQAMLMTTGALQALGLTVSALRFSSDSDDATSSSGPVLSLSPISAGRLGLTLRLTGF